jgi:hypothetical protein
MKKLAIILTTIVLSLLIISCQKPEYQKKIEPVLQKYIGAWNGNSLNVLDSIADKNFQLRIVPSFDAETGIEKLKQNIKETRKQIPDFLVTETERIFVGDTAVVLRWTITGTFKGENDLPQSGSKINSPGFSVIFFYKDKITGEWIAYSDLNWYKQLGFTLEPPKANNVQK